MLERKRDDMVRSAVLQLHTAIEEILNSHISLRITGRDLVKQKGSSQSARAVRKMLYGGGSIGFEMKLTLALALKVINAKARAG